MTVRITIKNEQPPGILTVCRIRHHQRQPGGAVMQDVTPPMLLGPGQVSERRVVTSSDGHHDFIVVEEGDGSAPRELFANPATD